MHTRGPHQRGRDGGLGRLRFRRRRGEDVESQRREFAISIDGTKRGTCTMQIRRYDDGTISMRSEAEIRINYLVYRYNYTSAGTEIWKNGRLLAMQNVADYNGTQYRVKAVSTGRSLRLTVGDTVSQVPPDAWLSSYWQAPERLALAELADRRSPTRTRRGRRNSTARATSRSSTPTREASCKEAWFAWATKRFQSPESKRCARTSGSAAIRKSSSGTTPAAAWCGRILRNVATRSGSTSPRLPTSDAAAAEAALSGRCVQLFQAQYVAAAFERRLEPDADDFQGEIPADHPLAE